MRALEPANERIQQQLEQPGEAEDQQNIRDAVDQTKELLDEPEAANQGDQDEQKTRHSNASHGSWPCRGAGGYAPQRYPKRLAVMASLACASTAALPRHG